MKLPIFAGLALLGATMATAAHAQLIHSNVSATANNTFSDYYNLAPDTATDSRSRDSAGSVDVNVQARYTGIGGIAKVSGAPGTLHLESITYLRTIWQNYDGILQSVAGSASTDSSVTYGDQLTFYTPRREMGAPLLVRINLGVSGLPFLFSDIHRPGLIGHDSVEVSLSLADAVANYSPTSDSPSLPRRLSLLTQVANGSSVPLFLSLGGHSDIQGFSDVALGVELALNQYTTLTWAGVEFFSAGGSRLRGTVESESGFDYGPSYVSPVPEPALFTSAAAGLLSFVLFGRVLRNFRPKKLALVAGIIEQSCEA